MALNPNSVQSLLNQMLLAQKQSANSQAAMNGAVGSSRGNSGNTITWSCEICSKTREDKDIEVTSISVFEPNGTTIDRNVRHCKDEVYCIGEAQRKCEDFNNSASKQWYIGGGGGSSAGPTMYFDTNI